MLEVSNVIEPEFKPSHTGFKLPVLISKDPLSFFMNLSNKEGPYAWLSLPGGPVLFLNDATGVEYIFTKGAKKYRKGKYNDPLRPILGKGLFLAEDESWWQQRRDMAPVFAAKNFPEFINQVEKAAEAMMQRWEPAIDKEIAIDLAEELAWFTLDVILRALYHEDDSAAASQIRNCLGRILRVAEKKIWSPLSLPISWQLKRKNNRQAMSFLKDIANEIIERRRHNKEYPDDLLSRLLASQGSTPETLSMLKDNILSFMLAGQETTANAIAWAIYEICRNIDVKQKLTNEVDALEVNSALSFTAENKLNYTAKIFKESLRMYAPAWTMSRECAHEDLVPLDDGRRLRVPVGTTVMLCAYTVHHRESYWENPEAFWPDRFSSEAVKMRPKASWFPFGGGARLCLGFKLAELEGLIAISSIFRKYNVRLQPGQQIAAEPIITLRPNKPILVRLSHRSVLGLSLQQRQEEKPTSQVCPYADASN